MISQLLNVLFKKNGDVIFNICSINIFFFLFYYITERNFLCVCMCGITNEPNHLGKSIYMVITQTMTDGSFC